MTAALRRRLQQRDQAGFTLVEFAVASFIFVILGSVGFTAVIQNAKVTTSGRQASDVNEEARVVLNRMSRELREASAITSVTNPDVRKTGYATFNPNADSAVTFSVDFDGDGIIEPNAADPEVITYSYDHTAGQLRLQAGGQTTPVLAANVTGVKFYFTSRLIAYDGTVDGSKDGVVQWEELDADPSMTHGNGNKVLDPLELQFIDSVVIDLTMFKGAHRQRYRTQVDLRNRTY